MRIRISPERENQDDDREYRNEVTLEPFQVKILDTDVNGRISASNGWAAFYNRTPDEYFGMSVVLLCTNPNFMGISVIPGGAYLF